jgi:hypothetical protein
VEVDRLLQLVGDRPWSAVVTAYLTWAKQHGYPARTDGALRAMCERHAATRVAIGSWITTGTIRDLIGAGPPRISRWVHRGLVESRREGRRWYISRRSLKQLARQQPEQFAGVSVSALTMLLDDQRLAELIAALPPVWIPGRPRPVRCIETGKVFASCEEAGRAHHITRSAVYLAAAGKRQYSGGYQFEYAC